MNEPSKDYTTDELLAVLMAREVKNTDVMKNQIYVLVVNLQKEMMHH